MGYWLGELEDGLEWGIVVNGFVFGMGWGDPMWITFFGEVGFW